MSDGPSAVTPPAPGEGIGGLRRTPLATRVRSRMPDPVVSGLRSGFRAYGSASAAVRPLPEYLVIGVKKGGTTSVANWLTTHPQVMPMMPRWQSAKSPHYFDQNYWRGERWYRSHFPSAAARAVHARRVGAPAMTGESSPYYVFHPAAAQRIAETAPEARLVVILREPVSRAYSHYWDRRATGHERLGTFEEALRAEEGRLAHLDEGDLDPPRSRDYDHDQHTYLARGEYAPQLQRYLDVFPREQLLVLVLDEMQADKAAAFDQVQDHLGLERSRLVLEPRNVRATEYPKIDPATRDRLRDYYAPHNAATAALLGRDLPW